LECAGDETAYRMSPLCSVSLSLAWTESSDSKKDKKHGPGYYHLYQWVFLRKKEID
jgi:hypothetical protein